MRYVLENNTLRVEIASLGAELKSVKNKSTNQEYMWQADPQYWNRTSPILFPFVGKLKNSSYLYEGCTYTMNPHGFARDMEYQLLSKTDTTIWLKITDNEKTFENYPFSFELSIGYELTDNELKVLWEVNNNSKDTALHFSIGAHPAFNCPIHGEDTKAGYKLYFGGVDEIRHHGNDPVSGLSIDEDLVLPLDNHRTIMTQDFFDRCTYIIENNQTGEVGIEDIDGNRYITVLFDMPLFALWSPEGRNAPFLCIEPWCGRCDNFDFNGTLSERAYNNCLEAGNTFHTSYTIRFGA